jgi:hypothetical protein
MPVGCQGDFRPPCPDLERTADDDASLRALINWQELIIVQKIISLGID